MADLPDETRRKLQADLVKLGDMMGDGLHYEPGGKWIARDYRRVARALGHTLPSQRNVTGINAAMADFLAKTPCPKCSGALKQTRSGSKRARCSRCSATFQCSSHHKG